ncbi:MAG: hypothetical protein IJ533_01745 [Prevotella sp.]|nr:hypothetical protein [Prevotella sp.]
MNQLTRLFVWLSRIHRCRGFGIQSPTDYWLVRYVVNEHWPYYLYDSVGQDDPWLRRKLGRLYLRLANWRQPERIVCSSYEEYWQAGCRRAAIVAEPADTVQLMHVGIEEADKLLNRLDGRLDDRSVVVVEGLWRNWDAWRRLSVDRRCVVTFDLYYCGIVLFDQKRSKQNYIINF